MSKIIWTIFMLLIFYFGVYPIFVKPFFYKRKAIKKLKKLKKLIEELGLGEVVIKSPTLSQYEIELMSSENLPTDEHILRYYKMHCLKHEKDNANTWTTLKPMSFEDWEKKAKTPTSGGYQFIIPYTCDAMIGMPPYQTYHRYIDYEKLVKDDEEKFMNELLMDEDEKR